MILSLAGVYFISSTFEHQLPAAACIMEFYLRRTELPQAISFFSPHSGFDGFEIRDRSGPF